MSARTYTKGDLEELVYCQLENLNAMNNLISIMKFQNELLENANKKLKEEYRVSKNAKYHTPLEENVKVNKITY